MPPAIPEHLVPVFAQFDIPGQLLDATPYGLGHINDTYLGRYQSAAGIFRCIHQRINHFVFKEPLKVMENIERVTHYARERIIATGGDPERETLNLIPTRSGGTSILSERGETWRTYAFIDHAHTFDVAQDLDQVYHAARAFGKFQGLLNDLPGPRLHETIPAFHHTRRRFDAFLEALKADTAHRAGAVRAEIDFLLRREKDASVVVDLLAQGQLPERVTHNDTKLNNVLIDDQTGEGICVIDLDTIMPGSALYDFGDLIRMGAATAAEDEPDLSRVGVDLRLFERLARGYLESARAFLTPTEWELLVFGGRLITYEQAIRFLGDYLNGDVYYKTHREGHNLDRARTQIKLVAEMERRQEEMEAIINRIRAEG